MTCEIIAVGTELLLGQIANTDAQYISRRLNEYGISVLYHTCLLYTSLFRTAAAEHDGEAQKL